MAKYELDARTGPDAPWVTIARRPGYEACQADAKRWKRDYPDAAFRLYDRVGRLWRVASDTTPTGRMRWRDGNWRTREEQHDTPAAGVPSPVQETRDHG